ncbi:MAG: hypothetical protein FWB91_04130 [Defluviitaleaceae bacterium]|nr:hypothetical protein [Defluviitaleaceae bacterium]
METLKQAKELTDKILAITQALILTGDGEQEEADIAAYVQMVEERESLISKLLELKQSISDEVISSEEFASIIQTIGSIAELDEGHLDFMENVRDAVMGALRKVKQGQKIHKGYQALPPDTTSHRFDTKH